MNLLEYEAKNILKSYNIPTPNSEIISPVDVPSFFPMVLKSQVPVGGRGKVGGIKIVKESSNTLPILKDLFNLEIKGFRPTTILAEEVINIEKEYYLSILIDRDTSSIQLVANITGGIEVEDNNPNSFLKIALRRDALESAGERLAEYLILPDHIPIFTTLVKNLYICFVESDATLLEINPLVLTTNSQLIAGDCKMTLDDAAHFRHSEWNFEDTSRDTNFVTLNEHGTVATIANGAGLAMATVDAVADAGLIPANFLDIGGGANEASTLAAFQRIMQYPNIEAIVINIFAGITRCDEVAKAIIAAKEKIPNLPSLYIRLAGTNFEEAFELLKQNDITLQPTLDACLEAVRREVTV